MSTQRLIYQGKTLGMQSRKAKQYAALLAAQSVIKRADARVQRFGSGWVVYQSEPDHGVFVPRGRIKPQAAVTLDAMSLGNLSNWRDLKPVGVRNSDILEAARNVLEDSEPPTVVAQRFGDFLQEVESIIEV